MTPALYIESAPPVPHRALGALHHLGAHCLCFGEFLLIVVDRREAAVRLDRFGSSSIAFL